MARVLTQFCVHVFTLTSLHVVFVPLAPGVLTNRYRNRILEFMQLQEIQHDMYIAQNQLRCWPP